MVTRRSVLRGALIAATCTSSMRVSAQDVPCESATPLASIQPSASAWVFADVSDRVSEVFHLDAGQVIVTTSVERQQSDDSYQLFDVSLFSPSGERVSVVTQAAPYAGTRLLTINESGVGDWRVIVVAAEAGAWSIAIEQ